VGGIPELVRDGCGILIAPRDAVALRGALDQALSKTWDRAEIARTSARSWASVAEETMAVCRSVWKAK
jgi:glycosyltransferase involved in cell wall biosynthesis